MKKEHVKKFWLIYRSQNFKKEIQNLFNKIKLYEKSEKLSHQYSRKIVGLVINRSPSFITKSLNTYNLFQKSLKPRKITTKTKVIDLMIFIPRFRNLFSSVEKSNFLVQDLLNLTNFWEVPFCNCGPKNFAYFLYCLEYHGLTIQRLKWCKRS